MNFLSSPKVSLACAALNAFFAVGAFLAGNWGLFAICAIFTGFCFTNYWRAR